MPIPSTSPDYTTNLGAAINAKSQVEVDAASGAIAIKEGKVFITKAVTSPVTVAAMTLALPIAGPASAGGDDGKTLTIVSVNAVANTVTTPALGLNNLHTVLTFSAAAVNIVELTAYSGSWYVITSTNATLSA